jgi:hypothetical protein
MFNLNMLAGFNLNSSALGGIGAGSTEISSGNPILMALSQRFIDAPNAVLRFGNAFGDAISQGINPVDAAINGQQTAFPKLTGLFFGLQMIGHDLWPILENVVQTLGNVVGALRNAFGDLLSGKFSGALQHVFDAIRSWSSGFVTTSLQSFDCSKISAA